MLLLGVKDLSKQLKPSLLTLRPDLNFHFQEVLYFEKLSYFFIEFFKSWPILSQSPFSALKSASSGEVGILNLIKTQKARVNSTGFFYGLIAQIQPQPP
jgi:hypothetical protein